MKVAQYSAALAACVCLALPTLLWGARAPVKVVGGALAADDGQRIRGVTEAWDKPGTCNYIAGELKKRKMNTIRIFLHNPVNFGPGGDWTSLSNWYDQWVAATEQANIYCLVAYDAHTSSGWTTSNTLEFWKRTAPKYKDKTHVIFEVKGEEPVRTARQLAPSVHIAIIGSPVSGIANTSLSTGDGAANGISASRLSGITSQGYAALVGAMGLESSGSGSRIITCERAKASWCLWLYPEGIGNNSNYYPRSSGFWTLFDKNYGGVVSAGLGWQSQTAVISTAPTRNVPDRYHVTPKVQLQGRSLSGSVFTEPEAPSLRSIDKATRGALPARGQK